MIPVLGIPVINRPDLLQACLASIDVPVERLIVIDNSGGELTAAAGEVRPDAVVSIVTVPPSNLGVAASWNEVIRSTAGAPWWCLVNADVTFERGALARLAKSMTDAAEVRCLVEFGAFGITAAAIDQVGWFDENFHPIYCEDTDYRRRCALAGVPIVDVRNRSRHVGSVSLQSPNGNAHSYPANVDYYKAKWGGWVGEERFDTPFDSGGGVDEWTLSRRRLVENRWP